MEEDTTLEYEPEPGVFGLRSEKAAISDFSSVTKSPILGTCGKCSFGGLGGAAEKQACNKKMHGDFKNHFYAC